MAARTPTQAAQTYRALRAFLAWCADRPEHSVQTHEDACTARKVREVLPQAKAKYDCLQREQLALWFEHVRKLRNPVHAAYLQALLLIGATWEKRLRATPCAASPTHASTGWIKLNRATSMTSG